MEVPPANPPSPWDFYYTNAGFTTNTFSALYQKINHIFGRQMTVHISDKWDMKNMVYPSATRRPSPHDQIIIDENLNDRNIDWENTVFFNITNDELAIVFNRVKHIMANYLGPSNIMCVHTSGRKSMGTFVFENMSVTHWKPSDAHMLKTKRSGFCKSIQGENEFLYRNIHDISLAISYDIESPIKRLSISRAANIHNENDLNPFASIAHFSSIPSLSLATFKRTLIQIFESDKLAIIPASPETLLNAVQALYMEELLLATIFSTEYNSIYLKTKFQKRKHVQSILPNDSSLVKWETYRITRSKQTPCVPHFYSNTNNFYVENYLDKLFVSPRNGLHCKISLSGVLYEPSHLII